MSETSVSLATANDESTASSSSLLISQELSKNEECLEASSSEAKVGIMQHID